MMAEKVVLAYSGGVDTSVAIKWLKEKHNLEVIAFSVDVGNEPDFPAIREKALKLGAVKAIVADAREAFVDEFVFPALKANAMYQGQYPLATALARPLMARLLVETAIKEGAKSVAHGCTGKGNDQVRFDVSVAGLAPDLKILAPARDWDMTRDETIKYAKRHAIPLPVTAESPYSIDQNLWGRSIECGVMEDPWAEPPEDAFIWVKSIADTPDKAEYAEIGFEKGIPVTLNGNKMDGIALIQKANDLAGKHGIGRIDHIEDRVVGIKSREVYEAPAALLLIQAHQALESLCLSKEQLRFKQIVSGEYSDLVYNGLWFTSFREDLAAYVESSQRFVTGAVRLKLHKGSSTVVGRKSPYSLYRHDLATYDKGDVFDQSAAVGFIHLWGLPARTQARMQGKKKKEG
ncbi:MAG: argininosuccinate synthase [Deltaproteobacteria bacterium]|nr:argininosuccinate synthase [Deltaproteobacteria bacterium]